MEAINPTAGGYFPGRGGLILVNHHYSDLIGPGSRLIWPRHFHCQGIYAVGDRRTVRVVVISGPATVSAQSHHGLIYFKQNIARL